MVLIHNLEGKRPGLVYIIGGILIGAFSFVLINLVPQTAVMAILIVALVTLSEMLTMPFMNSFWMSRSSHHNRGEYAALYSMTWSSAQIIAPFIGGFMIASGGFSLLWWILAGLSLASATGFIFLYKNNHTDTRSSPVLP